MLKEVHTRTHPARLTADPAAADGAAVVPVPVDPEAHAELAAELAEEEAELAEGGSPS
jgi:hypothetical protein